MPQWSEDGRWSQHPPSALPALLAKWKTHTHENPLVGLPLPYRRKDPPSLVRIERVWRELRGATGGVLPKQLVQTEIDFLIVVVLSIASAKRVTKPPFQKEISE